MTHDFPNSRDPAGADAAIDSDIALITAYLARELDLTQIVAVEERLETDAAFLEKVQPILDAWFIPISFGQLSPDHPSTRVWATNTLTPAEIEAGWRRHVAATVARRTQRSPAATVRVVEGTTITRRRSSMTRIAAVIAAIVLPVATFAQVVVYAANRVDMPGHGVARRLVAPFVQELPPAAATSRSQSRASTMPVADDAPLVRPLPLPASAERTPPAGEPSASAATAVVRSGTAPVPRSQPTPDRARIAALARQHQSGVVSGDTAADYIVMVIDAGNEYRWSTHGTGSVSIEVAGDTRTSAERAAYNREHRAELIGGTRAAFGRGGSLPDSVLQEFQTIRLRADTMRVESRTAAGAGARGGGGGGRGGATGGAPVQADTARVVARATAVGRGGGGGRGTAAVDTVARRTRQAVLALDSAARFQTGGRGGAVAGVIRRDAQAGEPGSYRLGWTFMRDGEIITNRAYGLQDAGSGESGIQGLPSTSVALGDLYVFPAGSLAPQNLRIVVVHLTPGTVWNGR